MSASERVATTGSCSANVVVEGGPDFHYHANELALIHSRPVESDRFMIADTYNSSTGVILEVSFYFYKDLKVGHEYHLGVTSNIHANYASPGAGRPQEEPTGTVVIEKIDNASQHLKFKFNIRVKFSSQTHLLDGHADLKGFVG